MAPSGTIGGGLICFMACIYGRKVSHPSLLVLIVTVLINLVFCCCFFVLYVAIQVAMYDMSYCILSYVH